MEAEGNPLGQVHDRLRLSREVCGVEHEQVAPVTVEVMDDGEDPPVVFGGVGPGRYEHRFCGPAGGG